MGLVLMVLVAYLVATSPRGATNADLGIKDTNPYHDSVTRYMDGQMPAGQHVQ